MLWARWFAFGYLAVSFCVLVLLPLKARAQGVPAPEGAGWVWCSESPSPYGEGLACVLDTPPEGLFLYVQLVQRWQCTDPYVGYDIEQVSGGQYVMDIRSCVVSFNPFSTQYDPGGGVWWRIVDENGNPPAEEPEPPASSASSPLATEATARELAATVAAIFWLGAAALGFAGYSIGARDA